MSNRMSVFKEKEKEYGVKKVDCHSCKDQRRRRFSGKENDMETPFDS